MTETKVCEFDNIYLGGGKPEKAVGKLRIAAGGLGWKDAATKKIITVPSSDIRKLNWYRGARDFVLRIQHKNGSAIKFDGFQKDDFDNLKEIFKTNFSIPLEPIEISVKGWNWGKIDTQSQFLQFNVANKQAFEIPLSEISNTNLASKNEVSVEFSQSEGMNQEDSLVEMRFYVPGTSTIENIEEQSNEDGEPQQTGAALLYETIKSKAGSTNVMLGDSIVLFQELPFLTPRGRYEVDMFPTYLRLRGKTYDYKVVYSSIIKLFLLPKPDDHHVLFVIGVDPPLRQGQTRYPFLVLQFDKDEEIDISLNLDDKTIAEKYEGKLQKSYEAPTYEVVSSIFRGLTGRKVTIPGSYRSYHGANAVKCSLKANEGFIYPLEKCFLFIPKPPTFIHHTEIGSVVFSRVGAASTSRTFDIKFNMKSGSDFQFSNINREEFNGLEEFCKSKKIKINNKLVEESKVTYVESDEEAEEGDNKRQKLVNEDEDESSVDEDYVIKESGSDPEEEYDEEYKSSGSDDED